MIGFTAPWLLAGLALVAVPILLHLVPRRDPPERAFPAMQYLEDATRTAPTRLHIRHLLLLATRVLLVIALVLAAAGATWRGPVPWGGHAPMALVVIVDNSASSAAVQDGVVVADALAASARRVLDVAMPTDRAWVVLADGTPRAGAPADLRRLLDSVPPRADRLALGAAVARARALLEASDRPGVIAVLTDAQRTALEAGPDGRGVVVARPVSAPPRNAGLARLIARDQPWSSIGGMVVAEVLASDTAPVPLRLELSGRPGLRERLAVPGVPTSTILGGVTPGWQVLRAEIAADEFRLDDRLEAPVRVGPPPLVQWVPGSRWMDAAFGVLVSEGRVRAGAGIRFDGVGPGPAIILPSDDPARIGALNRALQARGVGVQFGTLSVAAMATDSGAMVAGGIRIDRRHELVFPPEGVEVLATVGGAPWIVREGATIVVGSRFEPSWGAVPVSASFVPLLDGLVRRVADIGGVLPEAIVGTPVTLGPTSTAVDGPAGRLPIERGAPWRPAVPGVHWVMAGSDTVAALTVRVDPRESDLARADDAALATALPGADIVSLDGAAEAVRRAAGGGDLRALLLAVALLCLVVEALLAAPRGQPR